MPGSLGADFFRMVLERARDLLTNLHKQILENERQHINKTADRQRSGKHGLLEASSRTLLAPNTQSDRSKRTKVFSNHSRNVSNRDPLIHALDMHSKPEGGDGQIDTSHEFREVMETVMKLPAQVMDDDLERFSQREAQPVREKHLGFKRNCKKVKKLKTSPKRYTGNESFDCLNSQFNEHRLFNQVSIKQQK